MPNLTGVNNVYPPNVQRAPAVEGWPLGSHAGRGSFTPETALGLSAVRACVTLLAESVAQLPCELYRRDKNGGRQRATDHPVYDLIHSQPNRKDTSFEYFEQQQGLLGLEGNCYSIIERDGKGYPKELIPINPKKVIVLKGPDGMPYYQLLEVGEILPMRMMHHVKV
ncbi:phage portal protein, partial [Klebsiella pneumoniae]|uniref:phage portal protein n=1 Tax=Klebsiella pneumoniae TaxID=573 RepID=UPI0040534A62